MDIMRAEFFQRTTTSICDGVKHYCKLSDNLKILNERLEELNSRKEDKKLRLETELKSPGKVVKRELEIWLTRVEKINEEVKGIEERVVNARFVYNPLLGSKVFEKIKEVERLHEIGGLFDGLVETLEQSGDILPVTALSSGGITLQGKVEQIWESLMNDEIRKVGVYGMGGIGKTTAVKHINNRLVQRRDKFDNVIWVSCSRDSSAIDLQDAIASKLELDITEYRDETTRAAKLHATLIKKKRFVLILDDLWEAYHLEDIGIPEPTCENGCKLILTARSLDVCRIMDCQSIRLDLLMEEEALNLFLKIVGENVLHVPFLEPVVKEVVALCARLPLAVVTIAKSLNKVVDMCESKTALEELKTPPMEPGDRENMILQRLQLSYKRLNDRKLQDCLLYCAMYPGNSAIERNNLIEHLIVEGIINEMDSREAEFNKGHTMLNKLENACLLEGSTEKRHVKMHDLIREMALQIAGTSSDRFLVAAGRRLEDIPSEEKWTEDLVRVSLMRNEISNIPSGLSPGCPRLSTLMLNHNRRLTSIPQTFFVHLCNVTVLDLSDTGIESLPESIAALVNIVALLLGRCENLRNVPFLGNLRALKKLDLQRTGITEVPKGLETLLNLTYLNLDTATINVLPRGILAKLLSLQCLILDRSSGRMKVTAMELRRLPRLETFRGILFDIRHLRIHMKTYDFKDRLAGPTTLASYILQVGTGVSPNDYRYNRVVALYSINLTYEELDIPQGLEYLTLRDCTLAEAFCDIVSLRHAPALKSCFIHNCRGMKYVLSSSVIIPLLQNLEQLELKLLGDLEGLIEPKQYGQRKKRKIGADASGSGSFEREQVIATTLLPPETFSSLKLLTIVQCQKIKALFAPKLALNLQNLEIIYVESCEKMVEIISRGGEDNHDDDGWDEEQNQEEATGATRKFFLPKLRVLRLWNLKVLKSISKKALATNSLEKISIINCPMLDRISLREEVRPPPSLVEINVEREWWESLRWDSPQVKDVLQPFCEFWDPNRRLDDVPNHNCVGGISGF